MNTTEYLQTWSDSYKNDMISNIMPFWMKYGWDRKNGGVYTCVDRDGQLMDTTKSVWFQGRFAFTCSYAYNHIERNTEWLAAAKSTLDFIEAHCFDTDGRMFFEVTETGLPIRKRRYVFSETFASIAILRKDFMHPEFKALLETVGPNGEFIDTNATRTINPGHCIETSWFILEEAKNRNWNKEMVDTALTILDWSWEWGWDKEYGGIINFRDCRNLPSQDYAHDMKFWWPQTEAIIATLYAYQATKNEKYLAMHKQISDWTYAHFPDAEFGEWYGYLHRDGTISQPAKGNLFKGPFHIPRMMTKGYALCQELLSEK